MLGPRLIAEYEEEELQRYRAQHPAEDDQTRRASAPPHHRLGFHPLLPSPVVLRTAVRGRQYRIAREKLPAPLHHQRQIKPCQPRRIKTPRAVNPPRRVDGNTPERFRRNDHRPWSRFPQISRRIRLRNFIQRRQYDSPRFPHRIRFAENRPSPRACRASVRAPPPAPTPRPAKGSPLAAAARARRSTPPTASTAAKITDTRTGAAARQPRRASSRGRKAAPGTEKPAACSGGSFVTISEKITKTSTALPSR